MKNLLTTKYRSFWSVRFIICVVTLCAVTSIGQRSDQIKQQLFSKLEQSLLDARQKNMHLLAPKNYSKANQYYRSALADYEQGSQLTKIRKNIEHGLEHVQIMQDAVKISEIIMQPLLQVMTEAKKLDQISRNSFPLSE